MSSRKLNREERKIMRGLFIKVMRFLSGLSADELSLICRIFMNKMNKSDIFTVDPEDDE